MITIVDYGAGNLRSVQNTLHEVGARFTVTDRPEEVVAATKIVLPGVGHFGQIMRSLDELGVREALVERIRGGVPFLGICLGLHALCRGSEEAPELSGFGLFEETVLRFPTDARVPHMGWNVLEPLQDCRLLEGLKAKPYVYFAHTYYVPTMAATGATASYSTSFTALLERENVFGVQFHPEKSGPVGLQIVRNFVEL